ncbi:MAG: endonuclease [Lachnospiraceae bacterium]|nr:endonuclease [Lachnospiraceae bacterium]
MCKIIAKTKDMPREEWLKLRKQGIGGSDAGAVCGVNPYSSPMKVFRDKTSDETEEIDNEAVRQGNDLEDYVAQRFMEATGKKVRRSNVMYCSEEYPFMVADVDRLVVGEDAGLECKTASAYNADKWKDGEIPPHYALQCYHYMAVTGKKTWYIAAVILGREFVCRKLVWDDALISHLIEAEKSFWHNHVVPGIMPEPDGSKVCDEVLGKYFRTVEKESEIVLEGFDEKLGRREEILAQMEKLEEEKRKIEQEVKLFMQGSERASSGKYRVSWGSVDTARFDTKRFKEERPELYRDYAKVSSSRRFQVKAA